jgi:hypothetical protein
VGTVSTGEKRAAVKVFFGEYLDPMMAERGFSRDRRVYWCSGEDGTVVVVEIQASHSSRLRYECNIEAALVPPAWRSYLADSLEPVQGLPSTWGGVVTGRLSPSQGLRWAFETVESARRCGEALREVLPGFLAAYQELLDRETFLDKLRTKADLPGVCPNEAAVAILLVDSGPRDEFEQAVAEIEKWTPDSVFLPWIRRWQQRTTTPDPGR